MIEVTLTPWIGQNMANYNFQGIVIILLSYHLFFNQIIHFSYLNSSFLARPRSLCDICTDKRVSRRKGYNDTYQLCLWGIYSQRWHEWLTVIDKIVPRKDATFIQKKKTSITFLKIQTAFCFWEEKINKYLDNKKRLKNVGLFSSPT